MSMRDGALRVALDGLQNLVERLKRELARGEESNGHDLRRGPACAATGLACRVHALARKPDAPVVGGPQGATMTNTWAIGQCSLSQSPVIAWCASCTWRRS